jgi:DNA polymerase I
MDKWIFDIEADGLLKEATVAWIICAHNVSTGENRHWRYDDLGWKEVFEKASMLIGHNVCGYDLPLLFKLHKWRPPKTCKVIDTLIWSQVLDYRRFNDEGHSLETWGRALGFPKTEFSEWHQYSTKMLDYCRNDVRLSALIFDVLKEEYSKAVAKKPIIAHYIRAEKSVARWCAEAELEGWPFDVEAAKSLYDVLEVEMKKAYDALNDKLGFKTVAVDKKKGEVEAKRPRWTKQGCYDSHTSNWFGVDPCSGYEGEERSILGEYCRIEVKPLSLSSVSDVKIFLYRNGWVPTEWNYKKDEKGKRTKERSTPKITEDSLEFLGGDGKLYVDYLTASSRHGILKTWLENVDKNGNLHGECYPLGTPSMRARHKIIVNVPSVDSAWGPEMRKLFVCKPGWKLIGCDSSGNQARVLAHYLNNSEYTNTLLHGDIHQYNADTLTGVLNRMGIQHPVKRGQAKRIFYAFLFGASGGKLWSYIFGNIDSEQGQKLKNGFLKAVPGFDELIDMLKRLYGASKKYGDGYIPSICGSRIYVDSIHKLLVYLLQAGEKITCSASLMLAAEQLEERGIPYSPCIFMHDEIDFQVPEEYALDAAAIGKKAFTDGPKLFGIDIMGGDAKIGDSWYEVH